MTLQIGIQLAVVFLLASHVPCTSACKKKPPQQTRDNSAPPPAPPKARTNAPVKPRPSPVPNPGITSPMKTTRRKTVSKTTAASEGKLTTKRRSTFDSQSEGIQTNITSVTQSAPLTTENSNHSGSPMANSSNSLQINARTIFEVAIICGIIVSVFSVVTCITCVICRFKRSKDSRSTKKSITKKDIVVIHDQQIHGSEAKKDIPSSSKDLRTSSPATAATDEGSNIYCVNEIQVDSNEYSPPNPANHILSQDGIMYADLELGETEYEIRHPDAAETVMYSDVRGTVDKLCHEII